LYQTEKAYVNDAIIFPRLRGKPKFSHILTLTAMRVQAGTKTPTL
jgi:hypothetical protein